MKNRDNAAERYAAAKKLLNRNPAVMLRYYNKYTISRTLKVLWWWNDVHGTDESKAISKRAHDTHAALVALADSWTDSVNGHGGTIYRFSVEKGAR